MNPEGEVPPGPTRGDVQPEDVVVSALWALPFAAYLLAMQLAVPPVEAQWAAADPILHILPRVTTRAIPVVALVLALMWLARVRPSREALVRGSGFAVAGALASAGLMAAMGLALGPGLPGFIPPEESTAPGMVLSMSAGLAEELIFRVALLPLLYFGFKRERGAVGGLVIASILTGLCFAGLHELGPEPFAWQYFLTRTVGPGLVMSLAWGGVHPAFIVVAHCSAHLWIPLLFTAP